MDLDALDADLERCTKADEFSGVVHIVRAGEQVFSRAYGMASRAWQVPCQMETRFDTASVTKLFTAVAVLQRVEAGDFTLQTPVMEYLDLMDTAISTSVTPYHLLTHTSGIADDADEDAGEEYEALFVDRPNYSVTEAADLLSGFVNKPANFEPGKGCRYCNGGYILLGLMVERATGLSYRDYVREHVFARAGMRRTDFFRMDRVEPDVAEGTDPVTSSDGTVIGWRRNIYSYPPIGTPDGGAHSTAPDLTTFHQALVEGRLLGPELTDAMTTPHEDCRSTPRGMHRTGFGFEFEVGGNGEILSYWKEGINVGSSGVLSMYPAAETTVVLLSNLQSGVWGPQKLIDRMMLGAADA